MAAAVVMLALLTVSAGGYMGLRAAGIGPFGTLMSKGVLEERDRIVLADFENHTPDSLLAIAATELFRTALKQSLVVNVAGEEYVAGVLRRMEKEAGTALDDGVAREVAIREGLKAVVSGEIISVGRGYVVSARLVSAAEGLELWTDSETARDSEALFDAIDALSRRLRDRIGESLKTIRADEPLWEVTTSSLEALKKFIQAYRARNQEGDYARAITLFEEAIQLDTTFAWAHFGLGVTHIWADDSRSHWAPALSKAFELRGRLPDSERYYIEGSYYQVITQELDKAITAWRALEEIDPDFNPNNLALVYFALRDFEQSEPIFRLVIENDSLDATGYMHLVDTQVALGKIDEARITLERFAEKLPDHPARRSRASEFAAVQGEYDETERQLKAWRDQFREETRAG
jgi:tetratricopeptide (TPR) repeat protein